jgi:hypothetical protein
MVPTCLSTLYVQPQQDNGEGVDRMYLEMEAKGAPELKEILKRYHEKIA